MTAKKKPALDYVPTAEKEGEAQMREKWALAMVDPYLRHGCTMEAVAKLAYGKSWEAAAHWDYAAEIRKRGKAAETGKPAEASHMLAAQTITLDAIFSEFARRSANNAGQHIEAAERYMRLALKAQSNCRATLEALAKLHQPREQTVRHVHVNEGGQAVIADQFHHHTGGQGNGQITEQPHATGTGAAGASPALPGPDPFGNGVPIPGGEGQEAVQVARGTIAGGT